MSKFREWLENKETQLFEGRKILNLQTKRQEDLSELLSEYPDVKKLLEDTDLIVIIDQFKIDNKWLMIKFFDAELTKENLKILSSFKNSVKISAGKEQYELILKIKL